MATEYRQKNGDCKVQKTAESGTGLVVQNVYDDADLIKHGTKMEAKLIIHTSAMITDHQML